MSALPPKADIDCERRNLFDHLGGTAAAVAGIGAVAKLLASTSLQTAEL
jgi:hypothetical protein